MIGVFDSGYGGLTILKGLIKYLPQYDYLYLGDNARAPYGNSGKETITHFTDEAIEYLFKAGAQLIITGCNTVSSLALREMQEKYLRNPKSEYRNRKILGIIRPVVEEAVIKSRFGRIGVVGTRATVASNVFPMELLKQKEGLTITQQACPLLVPFIEEQWHKRPEARSILKKYLRPLKNANIDTLVLGCTHYLIMTNEFERLLGKNVQILDSGKIVAQSLIAYLIRHPEIEKLLTRNGERNFLTTDDPERFKEFANKFSNLDIKRVAKAVL